MKQLTNKKKYLGGKYEKIDKYKKNTSVANMNEIDKYKKTTSVANMKQLTNKKTFLLLFSSYYYFETLFWERKSKNQKNLKPFYAN